MSLFGLAATKSSNVNHGDITAAVVGTFTLKLRKSEFDGAPLWSVDDGPEGPTAEGVLAAAGALLDSGVAQIPGYGWRDR